MNFQITLLVYSVPKKSILTTYKMYTNNNETPPGVNARLCVDHPHLTSTSFEILRMYVSCMNSPINCIKLH